jgi:hypothetical protein
MSPRWARSWFAATALCALAGVVISAVNAANNSGGHFHPAAARAANAFAFFTIESNLLAGLGSLLLAMRTDRRSQAFAVLRLSGLTAIAVTGVVFHAVLAQTLDLAGWEALGNELVHTVVPVMTVVGWLAVGPRGPAAARTVWLSLIFPVCWLAFTLIRGAIAHWYPYPFIDVTRLGYFRAAVNCVWVALLLLGLSAGARLLDGWLNSRARPRPERP